VTAQTPSSRLSLWHPKERMLSTCAKYERGGPTVLDDTAPVQEAHVGTACSSGTGPACPSREFLPTFLLPLSRSTSEKLLDR
jgi:hypothetical protein